MFTLNTLEIIYFNKQMDPIFTKCDALYYWLLLKTEESILKF